MFTVAQSLQTSSPWQGTQPACQPNSIRLPNMQHQVPHIQATIQQLQVPPTQHSPPPIRSNCRKQRDTRHHRPWGNAAWLMGGDQQAPAPSVQHCSNPSRTDPEHSRSLARQIRGQLLLAELPSAGARTAVAC